MGRDIIHQNAKLFLDDSYGRGGFLYSFFDGLAAQVGGDWVALAAEGEGSGLGDLALVAVEEGSAEFLRGNGTGGGSSVCQPC